MSTPTRAPRAPASTTRLTAFIPPDLIEEQAAQLAKGSTGAVAGQLFLVTRPREFFAVAVDDPAAADPTTFVPFPDAAVVQLVPALLGGLAAFPAVAAAVAPGGVFSIQGPPAPFDKVQLRFLKPGTGGASDRLIYRSEPFQVRDAFGQSLKIFVFPITVPDTIGVTQEQVNEKVAIAAASPDLEKVDHLAATIVDGGLRVTAVSGRATASLRLALRQSISLKLDRLITHQITDFELDLPSLAGCFVNEDKIEAQIRQAVAALVVDINAQVFTVLTDLLSGVQGVDPETFRETFDSKMTLTFMAARFPVLSTAPGILGLFGRDLRNIVFDPAFGLPRKIA